MRGTQEARLRIGAWCVEPTTGRMSRGDEVVRLEARTLRLLLCLADRAGQVVTADELLDKIWPDVTVSQDSVYQAVASLRRLLGDNSRQPDYIATVPRQGYRLVAQVAPWVHPPIADSSSAVTTGAGSRRTTMIVAAIVGFFCGGADGRFRLARHDRPFAGVCFRCGTSAEIHRGTAVSRSDK